MAILAAGTAHADPSHKPNLTTSDYPDGKGGILAVAWCNGEKFPDGSYWHIVAMTGGTFGTPRFEMNCVIDEAFPSGTPAPPGDAAARFKRRGLLTAEGASDGRVEIVRHVAILPSAISKTPMTGS